MAKLIDFTGKRFGKLLVTGRDATKKGVYWICQCDCGNVISTRRDTLVRPKNPKRSCGCDLAQKNSEAHLKDETGNQHGYLTVLHRVDNREGSKKARWLCQCKCGSLIEVDGANLRNGSVTSCGCKLYEPNVGKINEIGQKYGRLTVLCEGETKNGHAHWICECECGNVVEVAGTNLRTGASKSCGCYAREQSSQTHRIDRVGSRYGRLKVIKCDTKRTQETGRVYWLCECDCGNYTSVMTQNLTGGHVQSCGCLQSVGEARIQTLLNQENMSYQKQYGFTDLTGENGGKLKFDFGVLHEDGSLAYLIEYDGKQHFMPIPFFGGQEQYEKRQRYDALKNEYCKEHNIPLIRIRYDELITVDKVVRR